MNPPPAPKRPVRTPVHSPSSTPPAGSAVVARIERYTSDIYRFGKLAVYDTACRLGVYLELEPEVVYLHAGTIKGARALGLDTSRSYLEMDELPRPLRLLEPWECEDFLCIYKVELAKLKRKS